MKKNGLPRRPSAARNDGAYFIAANPTEQQPPTRAPVLLPALLDQAFDYLVPEGTPEGALVETTLAGRKLVGVVWSRDWGLGIRDWGKKESSPISEGDIAPHAALLPSSKASSPAVMRVPDNSVTNPQSPIPNPYFPRPAKTFTLKPVLRVLGALPPLSKPYREWLEWMAEFTLAPKGAVLSLCGLAHAAKEPKRPWVIKPMALNLPELTAGQHEALAGLGMRDWGSGSAAPKPVLLDGVTGSGKTEVYFHAMAAALESSEKDNVRLSLASREVKKPSPLAGEDGMGGLSGNGALSIAPSPQPSPARGEGATPQSPIPNPQSQVLLLLPEIALTHQLLARFEKTFGVAPVVWHSRMSPAARARAWQAVARGAAPVVVGARSALFLPFKNLKLIIVDEEHDPSYKQEDGVLYHARDMAVVRAHFERIPIILASATPSLETMENVRVGKYCTVRLPERFGAAGLPAVQLVDMRNNPPERGNFLSPIVITAMLETLARGEQVLLFLNRRGYAPLLLCRGCGHRFECKNCSAWLVVHGKGVEAATPSDSLLTDGDLVPKPLPLRGSPSATRVPLKNSLHCHHCGYREPMPVECPECKAPPEKLAACGPGVERIAEEARALFAASCAAPSSAPLPHLSPATVEGSTARVKAPTPNPQPPLPVPSIVTLSSDEAIAAETWAAIERGEVDILVGTQMVAKGHHFPRLTTVVVVDADVGLSGADLRAGERSYQLLHQLGGRAGRGELPGRVLVQTYTPDHPVMQSLAAHDRNRLMSLEARERKAGGWPPFGQLAAILLDGVDEAKVRAAGQALARSAPNDARLKVLGPAVAPMSRLRGQYRYRLLVKAEKGINLQRTLRGWLGSQKFSGVRMKVDVNPYYFM